MVTVYWWIYLNLDLTNFKMLYDHFFGKGFTWLAMKCHYKKTYTTLLMSINYVIDIVEPLYLDKKGFLFSCQVLVSYGWISDIARKKSYLGKDVWNILKSRVFWSQQETCSIDELLHHSCLYDSAKTACPAKVIFSSYKRKCSRSIRLQDVLSFNITKTIWRIKFLFLM